MPYFRYLSLLILWACHLSLDISQCSAWMMPSVPRSTPCSMARRPTFLQSTTDEKDTAKSSGSDVADAENIPAAKQLDADDDQTDEDEYEYIEYDSLTESDFLGSEWLVGTVMESNPDKIMETWVRLAVKDDKNLAVWGDNSEGKWSFDVASQFFSISKETIFGKDIWAGVVDDYYFVQGTVRGWTYLTPAAVVGQWQARRLGVDPEEAGTPPWFQVDDDEDEDSVEEGGETVSSTAEKDESSEESAEE